MVGAVILPHLYHWSPTERRAAIQKEGLQPYSPSMSHEGYAYAHICLATTPSAAWGISGDMDWGREEESWDLWQVRLAEGDEVHYRAEFGNVLKEVRVANTIPPDRVWYVGTRSHAVAREIEPS